MTTEKKTPLAGGGGAGGAGGGEGSSGVIITLRVVVTPAAIKRSSAAIRHRLFERAGTAEAEGGVGSAGAEGVAEEFLRYASSNFSTGRPVGQRRACPARSTRCSRATDDPGRAGILQTRKWVRVMKHSLISSLF